MVRVDFDHFIRDLSAYFERPKPPAMKTMDLWYEEVRNISFKHLPALLAESKRLESWPKNLAGWMRTRASQLAEEAGDNNPYRLHPRRTNPAKYADQSCKICNGSGLTVWKTDKWPSRKDEDGNTVYRHREEPCLCPCSDEAEYGF